MQKDTCFKCHQQGHWARDCTSMSPRKPSPSVTGSGSSSSPDHPVILCRCGSVCTVKVSKTEKNPGRKFYACHLLGDGKCGFFKWVDEVKPADVKSSLQTSFPSCPCGAGICKTVKEFSGPDAGRCYFVCPIKKGLGACPFFQWEETVVDCNVDEQGHESKGYGCDSHRKFDVVNNHLQSSDNLRLQQPQRLGFELEKVESGRQFLNSNCIPLWSAQDDVSLKENQESHKPSDSLPENQPDLSSKFVAHENKDSVLDSAKRNLVLQEAVLWDSMLGKETALRLMSQSPICSSRTKFYSQISSAAGSNRVIFPSFNRIYIPKGRAMLYPEGSPALSRRLSNSDNGKLSPENPGKDHQKSSAVKRSSKAMFENETRTMKQILMQAAAFRFYQFVKNLSSADEYDEESTIRLLEVIDNDTITAPSLKDAFSALRFNEIEQSMHDECSMEEVIELYNKENARFDDISKAFEKAVTDLTASVGREKSLQEEASHLRDKLFQVEKELSCCQAETAECQTRVDVISKDMFESKRSLKKAEEALELFKQKEDELLEAKATLEKARIQLQQLSCV